MLQNIRQLQELFGERLFEALNPYAEWDALFPLPAERYYRKSGNATLGEIRVAGKLCGWNSSISKLVAGDVPCADFTEKVRREIGAITVKIDGIKSVRAEAVVKRAAATVAVTLSADGVCFGVHCLLRVSLGCAGAKAP